MWARLVGDDLFYSVTLHPFVGYFSFYTDETETVATSNPGETANHWLKIHRPLTFSVGAISEEVKSNFCGVGYSSSQYFVELKPFLIYKLTANVFATKDGSEYYFKHTIPLIDAEIKTICRGRINHQPCKAIAFGRREILLGVYISLSASKITHRTIEIEVMGAYKPGFF